MQTENQPDSSSPRATTAGARFRSVVVTALTLILSPGSTAFGQTLWQTHMAAAAKANSSGDLETEATLLTRALDLAQTQGTPHFQTQITTLTKIPLMLAYIELDKEALWKPLAGGTFRIDLGALDSSMKPFISTARSLANAYDNRWRRNERETGFKQDARRYGAEHLFRVEVALRKKFMLEDESGLAEAQALLGTVIARRSASDSQEPFREAIKVFETIRDRRSKIDAVTRKFGVADESSDALIDDIGTKLVSTQFYAMVIAMKNVLRVANDSLDKKDRKSFESAIESASNFSDEMIRATSRIRASWPRSPTFGLIALYRGSMYSSQYKGAKADPKLFPDSLAQGKAAFEEALSIFAYNYGPTSDYVKSTARDYADLLRLAGQNSEAAEVEKRYPQR